MTGKKAFGEQNPTGGEEAVSWQTFSNGSGGVPTISGDQNWGKMLLDSKGAEGRSAVYDLGTNEQRLFTLNRNVYGTGSGLSNLYIRCSATSFTQDAATPVWTPYFSSIALTGRYVQVKEDTNGMIAMWVWPGDYDTQAECDALITWSTGRITDLFLMGQDQDATPKVWMGDATAGRVTADRIGGKTPFHYMLDAAHAVGIRVHAWLWMCNFAWWGSTTGLMQPECPNNATYNDAGIWNFHNATARTLLATTIQDFVVQNPGIDGLNFDFEATTANITAQDMTDFLTELRPLVPGITFSSCTGASISDDTTLKISMASWFSSNLMDIATLMGYYDAAQIKLNYVNAVGASMSRVFCGLGVESNFAQPSDFRHKWLLQSADGFPHYCIFCWGSNMRYDTELQDAVDDWLASTISAAQPAITSVTVTPGTSFVLNVGGSNQTTNYADVSTHLYSGPLKDHIETAVGSENPAVIYYRANSTITRILVGDFEP